MVPKFYLSASVFSCWCSARSLWLPVTLEYNRAIVNVIGNTCAFPANTFWGEKKDYNDRGVSGKKKRKNKLTAETGKM